MQFHSAVLSLKEQDGRYVSTQKLRKLPRLCSHWGKEWDKGLDEAMDFSPERKGKVIVEKMNWEKNPSVRN